jgi:hypothetical protein
MDESERAMTVELARRACARSAHVREIAQGALERARRTRAALGRPGQGVGRSGGGTSASNVAPAHPGSTK